MSRQTLPKQLPDTSACNHGCVGHCIRHIRRSLCRGQYLLARFDCLHRSCYTAELIEIVVSQGHFVWVFQKFGDLGMRGDKGFGLENELLAPRLSLIDSTIYQHPRMNAYILRNGLRPFVLFWGDAHVGDKGPDRRLGNLRLVGIKII